MRIYAMKLHTGKDFTDVRVANTLVKDFKVYADGKEILSVTNNFKRLINLPLNVTAKNVTIKWLATNGCEKVILYSADLLPN